MKKRTGETPRRGACGRMPSLRIEPEKRICPIFDPDGIAVFPVAEPGEMGFRVLDDFCEEHIQ